MNLRYKTGKVDLTHGSGGRNSHKLIQGLFYHYFHNDLLAQGNDGTEFTIASGRMVMATDSHVISPVFFPGGDIGSLAINGTVNDVAMLGAKVLYLSANFILEEGFPLPELEKIVINMAAAAETAGVKIICGDTKVVEKGKGDGVFIATTGIGTVPEGIHLSGSHARPGDAIILSGSIGDHGVAILSKRQNLQFHTNIKSDSAALNHLVELMLEAVPDTRCLRDPTRGGLATTLNEIAGQSKVGMQINEADIVVKEEVAAACEILGLDPLYIANEGKLIAICPADKAQLLLKTMHKHPLAVDASIIGTITEDRHHMVQMKTVFGGQRVVDWLTGDPLPRIC